MVPGTEGISRGMAGADEVSTDPTGPTKAIWGTTVNIQESMNMFKDFLLNFTISHKIRFEQPDIDPLLIDDKHSEPFYPKLLHQVGNRVHVSG